MTFNLIILGINVLVIVLLSYYNRFSDYTSIKLYRYDDFIHFAMYLSVGLVAAKIYFESNRIILLCTLFLVLSLPLITEYIQFYIPGRSADLFDLYSDYLGLFTAFIGFFLFKYVKRNINK